MSIRSARRIGRTAAVAAGLAMSLAASQAQADGMYSISALGSGTPSGISDAGQVLIGNTLYQNGKSTVAFQSPIYGSANSFISPGGTIAYTGSLTGVGYGSSAHVVKNGVDSDAGAVNYSGNTYGFSHSSPRAVNDAGAVAGESHSNERHEQAFVSAPGPNGAYQPVSLGSNGGTVSSATAIDKNGSVVGWTDVPGQWKNHAFIGGAAQGHGSLSDIGTLGGQNSTATAVNNAGFGGQVVGWSNIATEWKPPSNPNSYFTPEPTHAFLYQNGKMTDLGTAPGYADSAATAINVMGQIVGHLSNTQDGIWTDTYSLHSSPVHAAFWQSGSTTAIDLNTLLPAGSGWILQDATGINASGQITGWGTLNGQEQAYLLTPGVGDAMPVPEPGSLAVFGLIAAAGLIARRKSRG